MILEPVFHVFHNKVDSKIECILRNLGDDAQVRGVLDWLDGTADIAGTSSAWRNGLTVTS